MSKSYNNSNKKTLILNKYSKKMLIFYKPILKILETESKIAENFSIKENSTMCNFLTYIFLQFNYYNKIISTLNISSTRTSLINVSKKINAIIKDHLTRSVYIDTNVITYIRNNINNCKIVSYENTINNKKFVFDFIIYDKININNLDNIVKNMLVFLQILIKISKNLNNEINECSKNGISITFFLTPFLKKLNITNTKNKEILGVNNVNSGFAYVCLTSGSIFIYRKEDFFKVFVHESLHSYGIDRALVNNLNENKNENYNKFLDIFAFANKPTTNVSINEALTEFWTSLLYLCVNSYQYSENLREFIYKFERLYKIELVHALYQISKILHYNDLTYSSFINNANAKYIETSHIFSYFIVKTLMIINHEHMLNSQLFELNSISKLDIIENNSHINIKLKQDDKAINKLFANLYEYAIDPLFIKIMNIVELEHRKHYKKYRNIKTHKLNKKTKQKTRKFFHTNNHIINMENFMLSNLKMMIYDYKL